MENLDAEISMIKKFQPQIQQTERYIKVLPPQQPPLYHIIPNQIYRTPVTVYIPNPRKARVMRKEAKDYYQMSQSVYFGKEVKKAEELSFITEISLISRIT